MGLESIYQGALMEHNAYPTCKYQMDEATHVHEGVNPSCGDDIVLSLQVRDGVIQEAAFQGHGCAISQASADIMAELITDKSVGEAEAMAEAFLAMIRGEQLTDEQRDALGEAAELEGISRMPARVKCAQLGWRTLKQIIDDDAAGAKGSSSNFEQLDGEDPAQAAAEAAAARSAGL
jgi:nitrogen fixation NifU-like protein